MMTRAFRVNVYTHPRSDGRRRAPLVLAYTRYQGEGACVHVVMTDNGHAAKRRAIEEHRTCPAYRALVGP